MIRALSDDNIGKIITPVTGAGLDNVVAYVGSLKK